MRKLLLLALLLPGTSFGAQALINCASTPTACSSTTGPANTGTGDAAWKAFGKANENFTELYNRGTPTFDLIGTGINLTGTLTCGTGCVETFSGTGTINAGLINGASVPVSQGALASDSSGHLIAGSAGGISGANNTVACNTSGSSANLTACPASLGIQALDSGTANVQSGSSYTLALGDANAEVDMTSSSANTVCIPPNATVALANNVLITIQQSGTGLTTVAPAGASGCAGSGVTLQSPQYGASTSQTYSLGGFIGNIQLQQTSTTDTWRIVSWTLPASPVVAGGTGAATFTAHGVLLGEGTSPFAAAAAMGADTVLMGAASADPAGVAVNDCHSGSNALIYNTGTHAFGCNTIAGAAGSKQAILWAQGTQTQNTTQYLGASQSSAVADNVDVTIPFNGTLKNLYVRSVNTPVSGQTYTITVCEGTMGSTSCTVGSPGALTCQETNGGGNTCADSTDAITVTAGQGMQVRIVASATSGSTGIMSVSMELDPT